MCLALASARVSALEDYPSLLQNLAHRRYLGATTHCLAPSFASTPQKRSSTERGHSGFSVAKDYRSRSRAWLRRRKEGKGTKTSLTNYLKTLTVGYDFRHP